MNQNVPQPLAAVTTAFRDSVQINFHIHLVKPNACTIADILALSQDISYMKLFVVIAKLLLDAKINILVSTELRKVGMF